MDNKIICDILTREELAEFYGKLTVLHNPKATSIAVKRALSYIYAKLIEIAKSNPNYTFKMKYIDGKCYIISFPTESEVK